MLVIQDKRSRAAALAGVLVTGWLFERASRRGRDAQPAGTAFSETDAEPSLLVTLAAPLAGALIGAAAYALYPYAEMLALGDSKNTPKP